MNMNKKALAILSAAHLVTDLSQGALPALLPLFKAALNLSYTTAGVILLFGNLTSSVIQPFFGYLSDKRPIGWLLPVAPLVACVGMSLTGWVPDYVLLVICVMVGGFGVASFHPEGFKTSHFFTGEKKVTGMAIFAVGGNLGLALGPLWALSLVNFFGLKGTLAMILPGLAMFGVLLFSLSWLTAPVHSAFMQMKKDQKRPFPREQIPSLLFLVGIVTMRAWTQFGLVSYIPFYYIDYLKGTPIYAGKLVSTFLMAGALGTLLGAPWADRWGHKKFLSASLLLSFPFLLLFSHAGGFFLFIFVGMAGMMLGSTFGVTVVMAQSLIPQHLGVASGLMVGFAIGAGGIGVTLLGLIADHWGVPVALKTVFILPLIGFALTLLMRYSPLRTKE